MSSIIKGDIKFLISKKINILIIYILMMLIIFIFSKNTLIPIKDILGINFNTASISLIPMFSYMISILTIIYIFLKVLEKDMEYMYSIIFTRITSSKWLVSKIISYLIIILILKLAEYSLFMILYKVEINMVFYYFICEITYYLMIETIILFVNLFKKKRNIYYILIILSIIIIPKNILSIADILMYIVIISVIINIIIFMFSYLRNNTFFSLIGGIYDRNKKYC